ncbi:HAMP domain-containing protein [Paenibacillus donghaensis]|uniref:sensor histidine kinase n=1 Tax=Paenibacillus donghaensis TaxID=414771 RepID=UPI0018837B04|nr:histidine kinase [Paenibacillus donghaensis]MBE9916147.1 HAMP domain-containing protein [Paenibacillus donghaensis]
MFTRLSSIPWNSLRVKLVLGLLGIVLPLMGLLIYTSYYSVNVIHNQVATSNKNLISVHVSQMDWELTEIERHLVNMATTEISVMSLKDAANIDAYMMAKSDVSRKISSDLSVYPYMDGFFVYSVPRNEFMEAHQGNVSFADLSGIRQALLGKISEQLEQPYGLNAVWQIEKIQNKHYLVRLFKDDDLYIGSWVSLKTLMSPLSVLNTGETGAMMFVDKYGKQLYSTKPVEDTDLDLTRGFNSYYMSGKNKNFLVIGEPSQKADLSMVAVIPDRLILENLPNLKKVVTLIPTLALLLLPISLWFLRKVLLRPLQKMVLLMRRIGDGNFNLRMENSPSTLEEFQMVYRTFNQMVSRIEELKINVYEQQLSKQRAELKQLQLQINPHFFMNSLNILYTLAQVKRYELIQEMTLCLVNYFRYMFQSSNHSLVLLKDELQHTRNYLRIQELRLPLQLKSEIRIPEYLMNTPIPPLMIQTFVENTIKHAVKDDGPTLLVVEAFMDDLAEEPMACITIRDNGKGFSSQALKYIRKKEQMIDAQGEHIGLWNVQERLRLQYGDKARMDCYNDDPQGAVVDLIIPIGNGYKQKGFEE